MNTFDLLTTVYRQFHYIENAIDFERKLDYFQWKFSLYFRVSTVFELCTEWEKARSLVTTNSDIECTCEICEPDLGPNLCGTDVMILMDASVCHASNDWSLITDFAFTQSVEVSRKDSAILVALILKLNKTHMIFWSVLSLKHRSETRASWKSHMISPMYR